MNSAYKMQKIQDWFTQQWVILWGKEFNPQEYLWLIGPFGELNGIGEEFIHQLAKKEELIVLRNTQSSGLLSSIENLHLHETDLRRLSKNVIDFYEHTSNYKLKFNVKWNPFFKIFGLLVNKLFSQRINQLNIPTENIHETETLISEIITLVSPINNKIKYTIWLRKFKSTGKVIYSGIYGTCKTPSGKVCIKAIFPLPKGNATVIMKPSVGKNNELILDSSGNKFGDAGFYFLLSDAKNNYWAQFISSFKDKLVIYENNNLLLAEQTLTLWNLRVVTFNYRIEKNTD
jgi:hypothetical protein